MKFKNLLNEANLDYVLLSFKYDAKKIYICIAEDSTVREVYDPIYDEMPSKSDKEDAINRAKKWIKTYGSNSEHILYGLKDDKNYGKTISYETTLQSMEDVIKYIKKYGD